MCVTQVAFGSGFGLCASMRVCKTSPTWSDILAINDILNGATQKLPLVLSLVNVD